MKRFVGYLLLALGTLLAVASCNGANDVTGVDRGGQAAPATATPVVTPPPALTPSAGPTPNPCRQAKNPCSQ